MSDYRYLVFPPGTGPTAEELEAFRGYRDLLERRVAYGASRTTGGLAIVCEAAPFDRAMGLEPALDDLVTRWRVRGAEVVGSLAFSRDAAGWKRLEKRHACEAKAAQRSEANPAVTPPSAVAPDGRSLDAKRRDAREAVGLGRIATERVLRRGELLAQAAVWLPHALWALSAALVLGTGGYLGYRLLNADGERRVETIERVAGDAITEPLPQRRPSD